MAKGVLIAAVDFSNVDAGEFNDWYDTEHIPERQRVPGFVISQRWIGGENPKQSDATYDLDSLAVPRTPGYRAIGGENLSPRSKRLLAKVANLQVIQGEQILPGDATAPTTACGLLLVGMTPGPEVEAAFNAWYTRMPKESGHTAPRVGVAAGANQYDTQVPKEPGYMTKSMPPLSRASRECCRRGVFEPSVAARNTWLCITSRGRISPGRRNGSRRARRPQCPSTCAFRSAAVGGSSAEATCA